MNYKEYNVEDYLSDKEFIKWIHNPTKESDKYWLTVAQELEDKDSFQNAVHVAKSINFKSLPVSQQRKDEILANTISHTYSKRSGLDRHSFKPRKAPFYAKIAATLLILVSVGGFIFFKLIGSGAGPVVSDKLITKQNPKGQKSSITLPDGTFVKLNADSKITFPEAFGSLREVWLEGEGYFDVKHDPEKPFLVHSTMFTTEAKGTAFNVRSFPTDTIESVSLLEGKVSVYFKENPNAEAFHLSPGEKVTLDREANVVVASAFDPDEVLWQSGVLVFKGDNMASFIDKIERWYGVTVTEAGKPQERINISGRFDNESLKQVLESMKFSLGIDYEISGKTVEIRYRGEQGDK